MSSVESERLLSHSWGSFSVILSGTSLVSVKCGGKSGVVSSSGNCAGMVLVIRVERTSSILEPEGGTSQREEPGMVEIAAVLDIHPEGRLLGREWMAFDSKLWYSLYV